MKAEEKKNSSSSNKEVVNVNESSPKPASQVAKTKRLVEILTVTIIEEMGGAEQKVAAMTAKGVIVADDETIARLTKLGSIKDQFEQHPEILDYLLSKFGDNIYIMLQNNKG